MSTAEFNESLIIDKHHQNLDQVNAFLKNVLKEIHEKSVLLEGDYKNETTRDEELVYDNITSWRRSKAPGIQRLPAEFHPSPQYDPSDGRQVLFNWFPPESPGYKVPLPPLVLPRPSSPFPMALIPLEYPGQRPGLPNPVYLLRPMHSKYPRRPPRFLSDNRYQNIYLRPPGPYLTSSSYTPVSTRPKTLPLHYAVNHYLQKNPHLINPLRPKISPLISDRDVSSKSSTIWTSTIGYNAKIWLGEIAPYTPVNEKMKKPKHSPPHHRKKAKVHLVKGMYKKNLYDYWSTTVTANTGQHGFLNVTLPEKYGLSDQIPNDSNKNWMSTTAGDVLHGKITVQEPLSPTPTPRYHGMMEELGEGYVMVFMIELCRMVAVKVRWEVQAVLQHTETIYKRWSNYDGLVWIGDPIQRVVWNVSILATAKDIDLVRTYASMMFHMLLERKQVLSAEVNSMIDEAEWFFNDDDGDTLLSSLKQFEDYPDNNKNSYWICANIIESFLMPFQRLSGTPRGQRLIYSINKILERRFPPLLREHHEGTLPGKASPKNGTQPKKRKRKRHHLRYKNKQERKRHRTPEYNNKNIYGNQYSQDFHLNFDTPQK